MRRSFPSTRVSEQTAEHPLTHGPCRDWCTSCVKRQAVDEAHKRKEDDCTIPFVALGYCSLWKHIDEDTDTAGVSAEATRCDGRVPGREEGARAVRGRLCSAVLGLAGVAG